jgi:hypothetical protein
MLAWHGTDMAMYVYFMDIVQHVKKKTRIKLGTNFALDEQGGTG